MNGRVPGHARARTASSTTSRKQQFSYKFLPRALDEGKSKTQTYTVLVILVSLRQMNPAGLAYTHSACNMILFYKFYT